MKVAEQHSLDSREKDAETSKTKAYSRIICLDRVLFVSIISSRAGACVFSSPGSIHNRLSPPSAFDLTLSFSWEASPRALKYILRGARAREGVKSYLFIYFLLCDALQCSSPRAPTTIDDPFSIVSHHCLSFDSFGFSYIASQSPFLLPSISCITLENTIMGAASRESVLCPRCLRIIVDGPHSFLSPTYFASHACYT